MRSYFRTFFLLSILSLLGFASCTPKVMITQFSEDDCPVSEFAYLYDSLLLSSNLKVKYDTIDCMGNLQKRFSSRAIKIANSLGLVATLCEYLRLEKNANVTDANFLKLRMDINDRITVGLADVASIQAEIECEKMRAKELQDHLEAWINKRINRVTVYSVIAGGVSTVIAGTIALTDAEASPDPEVATVPLFEQGITIAGAVIGTYYSFRALAIHRKAKFMHPRNFITTFWQRNNNQHLFSPFIWDFMSKPFAKDGKTTTGVDELHRIWEKVGLPTQKDEKDFEAKKTMFLGIGGDYEADELDARIEMYETIREEIMLANYDLKRLQQEITIGFKP